MKKQTLIDAIRGVKQEMAAIESRRNLLDIGREYYRLSGMLNGYEDCLESITSACGIKNSYKPRHLRGHKWTGK